MFVLPKYLNFLFSENEHNLKGVIQAPVVEIKHSYRSVTVTCCLKDEREFLLLLPNDVFEDLNVSVGNIMVIHPPW